MQKISGFKTTLAFLSFVTVLTQRASAVTFETHRLDSQSATMTMKLDQSDFQLQSFEKSGTVFTQVLRSPELGEGTLALIPGEPNVPTVRKLLALKASGVYSVRVEYSNPVSFENITLDPKQANKLERSKDDSFAWNPALYQSMKTLGADSAVESVATQQMGHLPVLPIDFKSFSYSPSERTLTVYQTATVSIDAVTKASARKIRDFAKSLSQFDLARLNSAVLGGEDLLAAKSNEKMVSIANAKVLVLTSADLKAKAEEFTKLHNGDGYSFTIETVQAGVTTEDIKNRITKAHDAEGTSVVIFYADIDVIPLATWNDYPSDSYYTYLGADSLVDILLGRIPAKTAAQATIFNNKVAEFLKNRSSGYSSKKVMLVAHAEQYPGKYTANMEDVRKAANPKGLSYVTEYGGAGAKNKDVLAEANKGYAIINYRGHGSETEWWDWDKESQPFNLDRVNDMSNYGTSLTMIFNIACSTGGIQESYETLSEHMLFVEPKDGANRGAVTVVAATVPSYTEINNRFDKHIFEVIQKTTKASVGQIYAEANDMLVNEGAGQMNDNTQMYLLLGDPLLVPQLEK